MDTKELIAAFAGTGVSLAGTLAQTNEFLQTISIIITILGAIVSFIVVPLLNWHRDAKKDGKVTYDELIDGLDKLQDGLKKTKEEADKMRKKDAEAEEAREGEDKNG